MKLLEILVQELDHWPEGKVYAYQPSISTMTTMTPVAFFHSSDDDPDYETIILSQIATDRSPSNRVTRGEWEVAKIKSAPYFQDVAAVLGEGRAVKELQAVGEIDYTVKELEEAFIFINTPQGYEFWDSVRRPNRDTKLKLALNTIMAAMNPEHYLQLHPDGSGYVSDAHDANDILTFHNTDELVEKYLSPAPKFNYWHLIQDRFKWIAKDSDGSWWAYENQPDLGHDHWEYSGDCHSLDILKFDIPCHWKRSLIERPTLSQGATE